MDDEWEFAEYSCPKCGEELRRRDCDHCGGEGEVGDLYDEDPLWYDPDTYETCGDCEGEGYHIWCPNEKCDVTREEIRASIKEEHSTPTKG